MEKFKGYVGVVVAMLLAWFFLSPQSSGFNSTRMEATALDRTGISIIILSTSEQYPLLARVENFIRRCPRGVEAQERKLDEVYGYKGDQCLFYQLAPGLGDLYRLADEFGKYDKTFRQDLRPSFDMAVDSEEFKGLIHRMQERAVETYPETLRDMHRSYVVSIYVWHALFVLLIFFLIWLRRGVGALVLLPITAIGKLLGTAHKKV